MYKILVKSTYFLNTPRILIVSLFLCPLYISKTAQSIFYKATRCVQKVRGLFEYFEDSIAYINKNYIAVIGNVPAMLLLSFVLILITVMKQQRFKKYM